MPKQDADIFEVLISEVGERLNFDPILGKTLGVLGHAELFEPVCNLLHWRPPTDLTPSVLDRQDTKSNTRMRLVERPQQGCRASTGWRPPGGPSRRVPLWGLSG